MQVGKVMAYPTDPAIVAEIEGTLGVKLPTYERDVPAKCSKCGRDVRIGRRSSAVVGVGLAVPFCLLCIVEEIRRAKEVDDEIVVNLINLGGS